MSDIEKINDPIWEYTLRMRLVQYIPYVRRFWNNISNIEVIGTGVFKFDDDDAPAGLMYRVTNTPVRSPIKNIQIFPFVPTAFLKLSNIAGGVNRMVSRVCSSNQFIIDEFTIIEKSNLPSTYHQGQFIAFVPTKILSSRQSLGRWVYLTTPEILALMQRQVPTSLAYKAARYNGSSHSN